MEFNAKKCEVLNYLGGIKLDRLDIEKDLGLLVRHSLNWNNHVDVISSKAQKNVLYRNAAHK